MNFLLHQIHRGLHWNLSKAQTAPQLCQSLLWTFGSFTDASGISGLKLAFQRCAGRRQGCTHTPPEWHHAWWSCVQCAGRSHYIQCVVPMLDTKPAAPAYFKTLLQTRNFWFTMKNNAKFHALNFVIEIIWTHCSFIHNTFLPDGCHSWSPLKSTRTPNMMTNKYFMEKVLSLPSFPHSFTPHHFRLKRDITIDGW